MYNQFVKNMEWFLELNNGANEGDYRYALVKKLEPLKDIKQFRQLKSVDEAYYKELMNIIWSIGENADKYPAFKAFSWELWGNGFDGAPHKVKKETLEDQLKMIDLLLSTQYWH